MTSQDQPASAQCLAKFTTIASLTLAAFLSAVPQPGHAADAAAAAHNPLSFMDGKLVFDAQERLRVEDRDNNFDFNDKINAKTDDWFLLQRFRLGMLVKPCDFVSFYVQGQDSREFGSDRDNVPFVLGAEGDDPFDLRQAYVDLGNAAKFPLTARIGRQEFIYGDHRLIGDFDWNNLARTFDAVKLRYTNTEKKFWVDGFVSHVVTIQDRGPTSNDGFNLNDANWNDTFAGIYASSTALPIQTTELYLLYRNKEDNNPLYMDNESPVNTARAYDIAQEIYTLGFRVKSTPGKLHGWDYEAEAAYQFGRAASQQGTKFPGPDMIDHEAFAAHVGGGYTWQDVQWKPRIGIEYNIASGDSDPNDNKDESFLNLFPTNHKFYGFMDLFAWKNIHNPAISFKCTPYQDKTAAWRALTVQLDGHAFWLYTNEDAWYRANAVARVRKLDSTARNADTFVGEEVDLTVTYAPWKSLKLQAGYSHFFRGDYVKDTASGANGTDDANFGYMQATLTF